MARNRRGGTQKIETTVELVKVVAHTQGHKTVYRGIIKHEDTEYFFTANRKCIPVVLGAPSIEIMKETAKALNNWHKANKRGGQFYEDIEKLFNGAEIKLYTKEMSNGVFMLKNSAGYMGYLPGAAGIRAVYMNHKDQKPYSCALKSWAKLIDNNEVKPFRTMASQGQKIREEMIPELMRIKAILDKQTNKPDPDGPGSKTKAKPQVKKEESKPQPDTRSEVQIEKETQQTQEEPQKTTRRRRRTTEHEISVNPHTNKTTMSYCGCCNKDTEQEIINDSELQCLECGSAWERFDEPEEEEIVIEQPQEETVVEETQEEVTVEETEEVVQESQEEVVVEETKEEETQETVEEIITEETKEEEPQISVEEEMEQAMNEEMKKVEEQVKEELEQRSPRRKRTRRTVEEVPQVTNEDMHNKETNEEPKQRQDNNTEDEHELHESNSPSNTTKDTTSDTNDVNDVSNTQTNDESTEDDSVEYDDIEYGGDAEYDINAEDEAGDSFEVEAGVIW